MMALAGVEPETLVSEPDALTTRPPPCVFSFFFVEQLCIVSVFHLSTLNPKKFCFACGFGSKVANCFFPSFTFALF